MGTKLYGEADEEFGGMTCEDDVEISFELYW